MQFIKVQHGSDAQPNQKSMKNGDVSYFSIRGNTKTINEDALMIGAVGGSAKLLLVADGMGGHPKADQASFAIVETFIQNYQKSRNIGCDQKLFDTLDQANQTIMNLSKDSGTTLCMALIEENSIRMINVGDSLGLILDSKGAPKYATFEESAQGFADELEVRYTDQFLINFMGFERLSYQVSPSIAFEKNDTLFLMTDGAHEHFWQGDEGCVEKFVDRLIQVDKDQYSDDATCIRFKRTI